MHEPFAFCDFKSVIDFLNGSVSSFGIVVIILIGFFLGLHVFGAVVLEARKRGRAVKPTFSRMEDETK